MSYNFAAESRHMNKLCSRLPSSEVRFLEEKRPLCVFEPLPLWGTYGQRTMIILGSLESAYRGLPVSVIVLIELFSLGRTADVLRAIIGSKSAISLKRGPVDPKFQVDGIAPHQPFFFSEN